MLNSELLEELERTEGSEALNKYILILDFSVNFPYANWEDLVFDFGLGTEEYPDKKINHRYPNRDYHTISKTYGKKCSKVGYPIVFERDELSKKKESLSILKVKIGMKDSVSTLLFPLSVDFSKGQIATVQFILGLEEPDKPKMIFNSMECSENRAKKPQIKRHEYHFGFGEKDNLVFEETSDKFTAICMQGIEVVASKKEYAVTNLFSGC